MIGFFEMVEEVVFFYTYFLAVVDAQMFITTQCHLFFYGCRN